MCLIIACPPDQRPSQETIRRSCFKNDDGNGIAWVQDNVVRWTKGLTETQLLALLDIIPKNIPLVIHNRLATVGGDNELLAHPFLLSPASTPKQGTTNREVLFHNGHWTEWKSTLLSVLAARRMRLPSGPWSDSRALAFLAGVYGEEFYQLIPDQRVCVLGRSGFFTYGTGWSSHENCLVSNSYSFSPGTLIEYCPEEDKTYKGKAYSAYFKASDRKASNDHERYKSYWEEREGSFQDRAEIEKQARLEELQSERAETEQRFLAQVEDSIIDSI